VNSVNITEIIDRSVKPIITLDVVLDLKTAQQILGGAEIFFDGFCWKCVTKSIKVGTQSLTFEKV